MESCPKCGVPLEIIECCGGGIYRCDVCGEYYFYGELIQTQNPSEEELLEVQEQSQGKTGPQQPPCKQPC